MRDADATLPQVSERAIRWARGPPHLCPPWSSWRVMAPTRTSVAAGIPTSKVKYSVLSSTDGGHSNRQKETLRADASFKSKRCPRVVRSHLTKV